jgi:hypothetical protein
MIIEYLPTQSGHTASRLPSMSPVSKTPVSVDVAYYNANIAKPRPHCPTVPRPPRIARTRYPVQVRARKSRRRIMPPMLSAGIMLRRLIEWPPFTRTIHVASPLLAELGVSAPLWAKAVAPYAERVATVL